jgi:hypothetical protein
MNCSCCKVYCVQNRNIWRPARETGYGSNNEDIAQRKIKLHSECVCVILPWCYLMESYSLEDKFQLTELTYLEVSLQ